MYSSEKQLAYCQVQGHLSSPFATLGKFINIREGPEIGVAGVFGLKTCVGLVSCLPSMKNQQNE